METPGRRESSLLIKLSIEILKTGAETSIYLGEKLTFRDQLIVLKTKEYLLGWKSNSVGKDIYHQAWLPKFDPAGHT